MHLFSFCILLCQGMPRFSPEVQNNALMMANLLITLSQLQNMFFIAEYYKESLTHPYLEIVIAACTLEFFVYIAVIVSSMVFIFFCGVAKSTSFILSEFDIRHRLKYTDIHEIEQIELRFVEQNGFCAFMGPLVVQVLIIVSSVFNESHNINRYNLPQLIVSTSGLISGIIFYFVELRKIKRYVTFKKWLFKIAVVMICIVNPLSWYTYIIFANLNPLYAINTNRKLWIIAYTYMVTHPVVLIIVYYFSSKRNNPNSYFHYQRWHHVMSLTQKEYSQEKNDDVDESSEEEFTEGLRHLHGYVEVKPEFMPLPKQIKPKNIELDNSIMSLFYISSLNLDAESPSKVNPKLTEKR